MKKIIALILCMLQMLLSLNVAAQSEKNIILDVPSVNYNTNEVTISGRLDNYTYSYWNNSQITLFVIKSNTTPAAAQLDSSLLFNIEEIAPERDGTFTYTFKHSFKELVDKCSVYVNYNGYATAKASYTISDSNYEEALSGRVLLAVNSPLYYYNGEKLDSVIFPYSAGEEIYIPAKILSADAAEGAYTAVSSLENATVYEDSGIICIGEPISNEQAASLQRLFGIHVAENGDNTSSGMSNLPVKTISRALELYRLGATQDIFIHEGVYEDTITLDAADAGLNIRGIGDVIVKPKTVKIPANEFKLVQDEAVLESLPHTARGSVLYADFKDCNINFPEISLGILTQNNSYYKVYQNNTELTNARYPNGSGFTSASSVLEGSTDYSSEVIYYNDTNKLTLWNEAKDARVSIFRSSGYYMDDKSLVETSTADKSITLDNPSGIKPAQTIGKRFFVYNLLQELDVPGEWYIDRENEKIYCFPLDDFNGLEIAQSTDSIIRIDGADNVTVENLSIERTRGTGVEIYGSDTVKIIDCKVSSIGKYGIFADNVTNTVIDGCEVTNISKGGIYVNYKAYHDPDLVAQNNIIKNCTVYNIGTENYISGAVYVGGTKNKVSHNTIYDTPHMAIWFDGNDNSIEYNEIYNALKLCDDAGVIYTNAGLLGFGNTVMFNYIHDCTTLNPNPTELYMIYLDYTSSGVVVKENIFDAGENSYFAFGLFGGGRNNSLDSNIFIGDSAFVLSSRYQTGTMHDNLIKAAELPKYIDSLTDSQKALWFEKYSGIEDEYNYYKNGNNSSIGVPRLCRIVNNTFADDYYGTLSSLFYESTAESHAFFKRKASQGFNNTKNNGTFSGNTYVTEVNTQGEPAMDSGCGNINLDADRFNVLYPQNNMTIESGKQRIVWDKSIGAEKYIVQIYAANNLTQAVFETETTENFADAELSQGEYVLKLTAVNSDESIVKSIEFECSDTVFYTTSGNTENTACDLILYASIKGNQTNVTANIQDKNQSVTECSVSYETVGDRSVIKVSPKAILRPQSDYTLIFSNGLQTTFKTGKLLNAESVFKKQNDKTAVDVKINSLLERNSNEVNVIFAGKTSDGALQTIKYPVILLSPQQVTSVKDSIDNGLKAEVYIWEEFYSMLPLADKMYMNE